MKSLVFAAVVGMGCVAWGQTVTPTSVSVTVLPPNSIKSYEIAEDGKCSAGFSKQRAEYGTGTHVEKVRYDCVEQPVPLKCGKYQHKVGEDCDGGPGIPYHCYAVCADDLHTITEKEWQEIREHIRRLEESICVAKQVHQRTGEEVNGPIHTHAGYDTCLGVPLRR